MQEIYNLIMPRMRPQGSVLPASIQRVQESSNLLQQLLQLRHATNQSPEVIRAFLQNIPVD